MTKPTAWMPMFWMDYLRDTTHLTMAEHGAYLLLIAHYWNAGRALPDDDRVLAKILHVNAPRWKQIRSTVAPYFQIENGHWYHARIERELSAAFDRKDTASKRARHAAATRWAHAPGMPQAIVKHSYHSKIKNLDSENHTDAARDPAQVGGSGPRASRTETSKERLLRLAEAHRQQTLRKGQA